MKWRRIDGRTIESDDGRYWITRTEIPLGFCYHAIKLGKRRYGIDAWDGSKILSSQHVSDQETARRVAVEQLKMSCEDDAHV